MKKSEIIKDMSIIIIILCKFDFVAGLDINYDSCNVKVRRPQSMLTGFYEELQTTIDNLTDNGWHLCLRDGVVLIEMESSAVIFTNYLINDVDL